MKRSESLQNIAPALLKAQTEIGAAKKGATNPFFHSSYADLGSIMEACKDALNSNGISVLQPVGSDDLGVYLETVLLHESGEFIADRMRIAPKTDSNPQDQGSAITYARRYSLQSMVFIPAEDDDGNKAAGQYQKPTYKPSGYVPKKEIIQEEEIPVRDIADDSSASGDVEKKKPLPITNDQKVEMMTLLGKKGKTMTDLQKAVDSFKVKSYQDLTYNNAKKLIDKMETLEDVTVEDIVNPDDVPEQLGLAK